MAVGSTPSIQYTYETSSASGLLENRSRLEKLTYPDGRVLYYNYGSNDGINDLLSRPYQLRETHSSGSILAEYSYTGGGQTVVTDYQQPDLKLDLFQGTRGRYAGLDRFGRTINHLWDGYNSTSDAVQLKYGYDHAGNRTWREDVIAENHTQNYDELYAYDGLDRLVDVVLGEIDGTYMSISSKTFSQDWTLSQLGNWSNFLEDRDGNGTDDLDQDRSHNEANEITEIDASSAHVGHDATGNMSTVPQPGSWSSNYTLTWDAWNRLVKVADGGTTVAEYEYDGKNRRIVKQVYSGGSPGETQHHYLSLQNQVLEVRLGSDTDPHKQFTWGARYIDNLVLRERDTTGNGVLDERLYALQDANWNVTALSGTTGTIVERFHYAPYGQSTVLEANFTLDGDGLSDTDWEYRYTSREFDAETGLNYYRARYYHAGLGRFCSRDPIKYVDGFSLYEFVMSQPLRHNDPSGESALYMLEYLKELKKIKNLEIEKCAKWSKKALGIVNCSASWCKDLMLGEGNSCSLIDQGVNGVSFNSPLGGCLYDISKSILSGQQKRIGEAAVKKLAKKLAAACTKGRQTSKCCKDGKPLHLNSVEDTIDRIKNDECPPVEEECFKARIACIKAKLSIEAGEW